MPRQSRTKKRGNERNLTIYFRKETRITARTITVKSVGKATVRPGQVVIRMNVEAKDKNYDRSMTLAAALGAIAESMVKPTINIDFTVKNPAAVDELILQDATQNARRKAEILCVAAGVKLGQLLDINYSWGDIELYAQTKYAVEYCLADSCGANDIGIAPTISRQGIL